LTWRAGLFPKYFAFIALLVVAIVGLKITH